MKKFVIKISLFFIAVALCDIQFGIACKYMNDHSRGGGVKSRYYVCKESSEEVLIFGSSRAKHHYVPDIIEDSLGLTCYNSGEDGNGIIYCFSVLEMVLQRYTPKMIIYDVSGFDIFEDDDMKYLDLLKPYYSEPGIDSVFWSIEPKTRLMMRSSFYRYNTTCLRVFGNYIHFMPYDLKGYSPLHNTMDYEPAEYIQNDERSVDGLKLMYFKKFIQLIKKNNIELVLSVSPVYKGSNLESDYIAIHELSKQYKISFISFCLILISILKGLIIKIGPI